MEKVFRLRDTPDTGAQFDDVTLPLLQKIYASRGVCSQHELDYQLKNLLEPALLKGIDTAVMLLADSIVSHKRIMIIGDFDADGATSSALAVLALRKMGARFVDFIVPNRFEYGYGLTPEIVDEAAKASPELIVTVDNGISSVAGVARAQQLGIQVVVTDHHLPGATLPAADAIVNPCQVGCAFPSKALAGVGVIFYVMMALRSTLRDRSWFDEQELELPNMAEFLDLVALGTVADVVPLDFNNRILVEQGLRRIRAGKVRPGIRALLDVSRKDSRRVVASDFGFALGPRLNAAGRLDDISLGIHCLMTDDETLARDIAVQLDTLNRDRQQIERGMQADAEKILESVQAQGESNLPYGICLYDGSWHQGVVGILASRVKERYHRPVIAFADGDNGEIKGSARSIPGIHIRDVLDTVASSNPGILSKFGGHAMAAGLSFEKKYFAEFEAAFLSVLQDVVDSELLTASVVTDGALENDDLSLHTAKLLKTAGPWGQHFPEPLFEGVFCIVDQRLVGEKHLKLKLSHDESGSRDVIDAIAFNIDVDQWPNKGCTTVKIAYRLDVNYFRDAENVQLIIDVIRAV